MTPKEKAEQLYRDAMMRWCYELSHHKNVATAKNAAEYVCDQIIESRKDDSRFDDTLNSTSSVYYTPHPMYLTYWNQVKEEIFKININNYE
jgi:hypothetical protein